MGMAARVEQKQATLIMKRAGLKPLVPFQSTSTPWRSRCLKCNHEVSPNLNNVQKTKLACKYCSGNAVHPDDAIKEMKKANLKPLEKFVSASKPWKSKCMSCGKIVSPKYKSISAGQGGCRECGIKKRGLALRLDSKKSIDIMIKAHLQPMVEYPGSGVAWKCRCMTCKKIVYPRLSSVKAKGSGCAFCAEVKVDKYDAVKLFKESDLKPIADYPGNKIPWRSIHIPCGREVSPSYLSIKKGQGPCKYCAGKAIYPKDAVDLFLRKGLKPIEPYPGDNKKPWKCIHLTCGNQVSPKYAIVARGESMGCHYCSDQFVDPEEAYQLFLTKGFKPLVPYPGSNKPWKSLHIICGSEAKPSFGKIKAGRKGCAVCSGVVPISQARAYEFFRSKGLEPLEKFKGPHKPWKSKHMLCGREVNPRWTSVQQGGSGCAYCSGNKVDINDVNRLLKENNLKLLGKFINTSKPLVSIHIPCGKKVAPTYSGLRVGQGPCEFCGKNMVSREEALALLKKNDFKPLVKFPGGSKPWKCLHKKCGQEIMVTTTYLRRGGKGCNVCAGLAPITSNEALTLFKSNGFTPIEKFKGAKKPWKSKHDVCGKVVSPTWGSLKSGRGCKYCQIGGINLLAPAYLYLITHDSLNSHKIGIGGFDSSLDRLEKHIKQGWKTYRQLDLDTAEEAYEIEQGTLNWLRNDLGLQQYLLAEQMPQRGHTETVDASEIDLPTIWAKVEELSRVKR
jgi:hypothetical protein